MFTPAELDQVSRVATLCALDETSERAVSYEVRKEASLSLSNVQLSVVDWASDECTRQMSGPLSVHWMLTAYQWAYDRGPDAPWTLQDVEHLGLLVEPNVNTRGVRKTPVTIRQGTQPLPASQVPSALTSLLDAVNRGVLDPKDFYQEFQTIHPFKDGNGRVGAVLYNVLNKSLAGPRVPPRFKK